MAKVHKARKSTQKYSFQKKHVSTKLLLIILAVVVAAGIGLKLWYDSWLTGEVAVTAPSNETLNALADNWEKLNADTENFLNYYTLMGSADGTDGNGTAYLIYVGDDRASVELQLNAGEKNEDVDPIAAGMYTHTTLTDAINGVAPWGQKTTSVQLANANAGVIISSTGELNDAIVAEILADLEARATAPVIEEAPVEEAPAETTEEVPAE